LRLLGSLDLAMACSTLLILRDRQPFDRRPRRYPSQ